MDPETGTYLGEMDVHTREGPSQLLLQLTSLVWHITVRYGQTSNGRRASREFVQPSYSLRVCPHQALPN